jgi:hypothetical protein
VLLFCSVLSLSVILVRLFHYARLSRVSRQAFMARLEGGQASWGLEVVLPG